MARKNDSTIVKIQLAAWREQMLNRLLPLTSAIATLGVIVGVVSVIDRGKEIYVPIYVASWLLLLLITFVKRLTYTTKAAILLGLIAALGVAILSETGLSGEGRSFLVVLPIATMVLLDWKYSLASMLLSAIIFLGFGILDLPESSPVDSGNFINWLLAATLAAMLATGVIISLRALLENLITTLEKEQKARQQLREISDHWEKKVEQRTRELERKSIQLAISHEINQSLNRLQDPDRLLQHLVTHLRETLDLDQVAIFMIEPDGEVASLRAAAGRSADLWLSEGRAARPGDSSLVGWCLERGRGRMVVQQADMIPPILPGTRSAMGLPMKIDDQIVGTLVLQSRLEEAFSDEELSIWQAAADEIATAASLAARMRSSEAALSLASGARIAGAPRFAARIRETLDIEAVIKTAAREIGEAMNLAAVEVSLGTPPATPGTGPDDTASRRAEPGDAIPPEVSLGLSAGGGQE